jgi:non-canonical (house-cleaning) NTP pyrophosphatase
MSSYLREMNSQIWWMVDVGFSHALEDCPQTQASEKGLNLKSHAFEVLSSALSVEIEDMIKIEHGLLKSANLFWKALEQMFGSSNDKRSSSISIPENISSSSMHIDQDQEEQSSVQKEKVKSISLGKQDGLVS